MMGTDIQAAVKKSKTPKHFKTVVLLITVMVLLIYRAYMYWVWPTATIKVGDATLQVLVADTYEHDVKGWSGRTSMGRYQGMLFYFPTRDQHTMVMRDMEFPLDIVWIDNGMVVDIATNLQPEKGRTEAELTPYQARAPSTHVLEIGAGKAVEYGLHIGDRVVVAR